MKSTVLKTANALWLCKDGKLVALPANTDCSAYDVIDASKAQAMPGRICAHTHIYSGLCPLGMPAPEKAPENFLQILERIWWRLDRGIDAQILRACARLYAAETLFHGTTTFLDHHESPNLIEGSLDILSEACDEIGIRALLCYGATERNYGYDEGHRGLEECRRFIKANKNPLQIGAVSLHASFTCSDKIVREAGEMCQELGAIMHVHVAEDAADIADARSRGYVGPFERLLAFGALPKGSIIAHGVHLTAEEVAAADALGIWFAQNPRSNQGNRVGYAKNLVASKHVALGCDGWDAKMQNEIDCLRKLSAEAGEDAEAVIKARVAGGYKLCEALYGMPFDLVEGGAADVIVEKEGKVNDVIVGGRIVVRDGKLCTADMDAIRAEAKEAADRLWAAMKKLA